MHSKQLLDLRPEHARIIQSVLDRYVPNMEIWAFGSRATGKARTTSDLDIVIRTEKPLDWLFVAKIREAFSISDLPMKVDVLDWSTLGQEMRERITCEHIVL